MTYCICNWCQSFPDTYLCCHPKNRWNECPYYFDDYCVKTKEHKCKYFEGKVFIDDSVNYIEVKSSGN